jgi:hypothetical protein
MYHDSVRLKLGEFPNRFRDSMNKNFVQVTKVKSEICFFTAREEDGANIYVFMTQYEANELLKHLQQLLNEK